MREILLGPCRTCRSRSPRRCCPKFRARALLDTVANAALSPVVVSYTTRLGEKLASGGYTRDLLLLHTGGGVMTPASVKDYAARSRGSGIAAGAIASRHIARSAASRTRSARHGRHVHRRLARLRGPVARHQGLVHRVRLPHPLLLDRGADDRPPAAARSPGPTRRDRFRNGPQSAAPFRPRLLRQTANASRPTPTPTSRLGRLGTSWPGGKVQLDPALAREAVEEGVASPSACRPRKRPTRSCASPTPTCRTPCA